MILGRKLNKQNWMNRLLKRKTDIEKESSDDNILIISNDYDRSVFSGLLLGATSTSRKVLFVSNSDFSPEVDTLKHMVLKVDLNDIDFNRYNFDDLSQINISQVFEKALNKYDISANEFLHHNFIWVYNSRKFNKIKMMDTFYADIIIKLHQEFNKVNNGKVAIALNDWNFNEELKLTKYLIELMKNKDKNYSKVIASMVSSINSNENYLDKLMFAEQFKLIKIDGKISKSEYSKYLQNTPEQIDNIDLTVQSLKDGEFLLINKTKKEDEPQVLKNINYKEVLWVL